MFDDDPRWGSDPRERDNDSRDLGRAEHDPLDVRDRDDIDSRDVFVEKVELPRGLERELVRDRDREYSLRGSEARTLSILGAFRVVSSRDLRDHNERPADPRKGDLRHLRQEGLVRTIPMAGTKDVAVVLTDRGRDLLDSHRRDTDDSRDHRQTFYSELKKPREMEHDSQIYRAYVREAERLQERGARIERVVLDYELKREYQRFLQERNRDRHDSDGRPDRTRAEIEDWAREHDLPYFDEQVHFPDLRIEDQDADGRWDHLDVEIVTPHYRGAHGAAAARSGFTCVGGFERPHRRQFTRSRPRRGAPGMTAEDRVTAVARFGFTERQARFLVAVMLHSGVCLQRQYATFAGIVHEQKTRKCFAKLVRRGIATAYRCRHNRGRVYHLHQKVLYRVIGQPESRHRRRLSAARVLDGLALLDAVIASPELIWLATEEEKSVHLSALTGVPIEKLPQEVLGKGPSKRVRLFPDNVPIGIDLSGRWVFVYLATNPDLDAFRLFLQRHFNLFCHLPAWTLRIVVPPHLETIADMCKDVLRDEFAKPIDERMVKMLRAYFTQRQRHEQGAPIDNEEEYDQAHFAFRAARYQVLYRQWLRLGEVALEGRSSRTIADAIARGAGVVDTFVLPHQYRHLMPLLNARVCEPEGAEEGDEGPTRSRPPVSPSDAPGEPRGGEPRPTSNLIL